MILNIGLKSRNSSCAPTLLQVSEAQLLRHESPLSLSGVVGSGEADRPFSCPVVGANGIVEEVCGVFDWKRTLLGCLRQLLLL